MKTTPINRLVQEFNILSIEDKEYAYHILHQQLVESKRDAIAKRAKSAMMNFKKGKIKKGSVQDLYTDLEND